MKFNEKSKDRIIQFLLDNGFKHYNRDYYFNNEFYVWLDDSLSTGIEIYVYDVNPKYNGTFDETGFENTSDLFLSHTYKIFDEDRFYNFIGVK